MNYMDIIISLHLICRSLHQTIIMLQLIATNSFFEDNFRILTKLHWSASIPLGYVHINIGPCNTRTLRETNSRPINDAQARSSMEQGTDLIEAKLLWILCKINFLKPPINELKYLYDNALRWTHRALPHDKSTLVQVTDWCCQVL